MGGVFEFELMGEGRYLDLCIAGLVVFESLFRPSI